MKKAKEYSEKLLFLLDINAELTELDIQRAYVAGYNQAIEDSSKLLDESAQQHFKMDKHPAWDESRCEETGLSSPGYAGTIVRNMAKVIRRLKQGGGA